MILKYKIVLFLIILWLSTVNVELRAQDYLDRQLEYANNLFENELYFDAVTEFKRLQFFDKFHIYDFDCNYKIGISYKFGGFYDEAIRHLKTAEVHSRNTEEKVEVNFQIVRCNILRKTTERALQILSEMENNPEFIGVIDEINYWRGWSFMIDDNWEDAAQAFNLIKRDHPLKTLAQKVADDKYSVTFATVISYILPGFGQFYTGNYFSGFMSLAYNALWGYLTVNSFLEDRAFDGVMTGSLLWLRFYRGNVQNAGKYAEEKNIEIANRAFQFLETNFEGIKP